MPDPRYCSTATAAGRHKRRFRSVAEARRVARLMTGGELGHLTGQPYRPYECGACGGFHLTSRPLAEPDRAWRETAA